MQVKILDSGVDSGGSRGLVGGGYVGEPFPQGAPFLIFAPLGGEIDKNDFNFDATYPWSAGRPDLFGVIALGEFGRTDWRCIEVEPPPSDPYDIFREIEELVATARDERPHRVDEISRPECQGSRVTSPKALRGRDRGSLSKGNTKVPLDILRAFVPDRSCGVRRSARPLEFELRASSVRANNWRQPG